MPQSRHLAVEGEAASLHKRRMLEKMKKNTRNENTTSRTSPRPVSSKAKRRTKKLKSPRKPHCLFCCSACEQRLLQNVIGKVRRHYPLGQSQQVLLSLRHFLRRLCHCPGNTKQRSDSVLPPLCPRYQQTTYSRQSQIKKLPGRSQSSELEDVIRVLALLANSNDRTGDGGVDSRNSSIRHLVQLLATHSASTQAPQSSNGTLATLIEGMLAEYACHKHPGENSLQRHNYPHQRTTKKSTGVSQNEHTLHSPYAGPHKPSIKTTMRPERDDLFKGVHTHKPTHTKNQPSTYVSEDSCGSGKTHHRPQNYATNDDYSQGKVIASSTGSHGSLRYHPGRETDGSTKRGLLNETRHCHSGHRIPHSAKVNDSKSSHCRIKDNATSGIQCDGKGHASRCEISKETNQPSDTAKHGISFSGNYDRLNDEFEHRCRVINDRSSNKKTHSTRARKPDSSECLRTCSESKEKPNVHAPESMSQRARACSGSKKKHSTHAPESNPERARTCSGNTKKKTSTHAPRPDSSERDTLAHNKADNQYGDAQINHDTSLTSLTHPRAHRAHENGHYWHPHPPSPPPPPPPPPPQHLCSRHECRSNSHRLGGAKSSDDRPHCHPHEGVMAETGDSQCNCHECVMPKTQRRLRQRSKLRSQERMPRKHPHDDSLHECRKLPEANSVTSLCEINCKCKECIPHHGKLVQRPRLKGDRDRYNDLAHSSIISASTQLETICKCIDCVGIERISKSGQCRRINREKPRTIDGDTDGRTFREESKKIGEGCGKGKERCERFRERFEIGREGYEETREICERFRKGCENARVGHGGSREGCGRFRERCERCRERCEDHSSSDPLCQCAECVSGFSPSEFNVTPAWDEESRSPSTDSCLGLEYSGDTSPQSPLSNEFPAFTEKPHTQTSPQDGVHEILAEHHERVKQLRQRTNESKAFLQQKLRERLTLKLEQKKSAEKDDRDEELVEKQNVVGLNSRSSSFYVSTVKSEIVMGVVSKPQSATVTSENSHRTRSSKVRLPNIQATAAQVSSDSEEDVNITSSHNAFEHHISAKYNAPIRKRSQPAVRHPKNGSHLQRGNKAKPRDFQSWRVHPKKGLNKDGLPNVLNRNRATYGAPFTSGAIETVDSDNEELNSLANYGTEKESLKPVQDKMNALPLDIYKKDDSCKDTEQDDWDTKLYEGVQVRDTETDKNDTQDNQKSQRHAMTQPGDTQYDQGINREEPNAQMSKQSLRQDKHTPQQARVSSTTKTFTNGSQEMHQPSDDHVLKSDYSSDDNCDESGSDFEDGGNIWNKDNPEEDIERSSDEDYFKERSTNGDYLKELPNDGDYLKNSKSSSSQMFPRIASASQRLAQDPEANHSFARWF